MTFGPVKPFARTTQRSAAPRLVLSCVNQGRHEQPQNNMVALKKYERMEASGLWRAEHGAQRRDVIVVLGDATLTIKTASEQPLAHWSIAAIDRANPGGTPARFHPDGDPGEELELGADAQEMIDALDTLRRAVARSRGRPGHLRWIGLAASIAAVAYAAIFWLPGALVDHTVSVVPDVARQGVGQSLLARLERITGPACATSQSASSLARLGTRLATPNLAVMRSVAHSTVVLPGGYVLLRRQLVEDHEDPAVAAGYILAAKAGVAETDLLRQMLEHTGTFATFRLLTTGAMSDASLDSYAEHLLATPQPTPGTAALLTTFGDAAVRSTPYAYAQDVTGEGVLPLIEGDPMRGKPISPVLTEADWTRLQAVCGG